MAELIGHCATTPPHDRGEACVAKHELPFDGFGLQRRLADTHSSVYRDEHRSVPSETLQKLFLLSLAPNYDSTPVTPLSEDE